MSGKSVAIIGTRGYPSYYGGFETAIRRIAPYLVDHDWAVTVYGRPGASQKDDPAIDRRVTTRETWGIESKSLSTLTFGLTSVLNAILHKPDVALVMNVANGFWLPLLRFRGIPTLVNVDGIEWDRAKWGRFAKFIFHTGAKLTARFGNRMVYDSQAIAARWKAEFGLDGEFIAYGGDVPSESDPPLDLPHRGYVLMVARFVPENTVHAFLEAAKRLSDRWPIVIVGSSGYGGELDLLAAQLAASSANVRWLGHLSNDDLLNSLWQHAGVYFHGHSVGGTNPALVQAMAAASPVVARDTAFNREVLAEAGRFVSPDADSIREVIDTVMSSEVEMETMSAAARARALQHYSWDDICAAYERSLRKLATAK